MTARAKASCPAGAYFDANATHPLLKSVRETLAQALLEGDARLSNPSSIHRPGQRAKALMAQTRQELCLALGRPDGDEFVFTSGATESINLAVRGFVQERQSLGRPVRLLTTTLEHRAVLDTLSDVGVDMGFVPVSRSGALDETVLLAQTLEAVESGGDVLFCAQIANNETGLLPKLLPALEKLHAAHAPRPLRHLPKGRGGRHPLSAQQVWVLLDGAQALGKCDESYLRSLLHYADYLALSGHKIGAPAGLGVLWLRPGSPFHAQITGGVQERRRRAGTPNILGLFGLHAALEEWRTQGEKHRAHLGLLRDELLSGLEKIPGCTVHSLEGDRLPNTLNFHVEGCIEESLLLNLDLAGFAVSSGAACNSGSLKPSHVLLALGYSEAVALSSIRVSLGVENTLAEVKSFLDCLEAKVDQIRSARAKAREIFQEEENAPQSTGTEI